MLRAERFSEIRMPPLPPAEPPRRRWRRFLLIVLAVVLGVVPLPVLVWWLS